MSILKTNEANCKDCHKCIRHCPVNAIRFIDGHAQIDPERCILDGVCYSVCPQRAKSIRNDIDIAKEIVKKDIIKVASIAPSFYGYYQEPLASKMLAAVKKLGFDKLEQTSKTAHSVSISHYDYYIKTKDITISSSCPSAVNLIEKYYPELIKYLAPVDSPMMAHYKLLEKELSKNFEMVFFGPCIAKKQEIENSKIAACLTFEELEKWLADENIDIESLEPVSFEKFYSGKISLFPLLGGLIESAGLKEDCLKNEIISVSGTEKIKILLDEIRNNRITSGFIEILACDGGCLMGPARPDKHKKSSIYELKTNIISKFENVDLIEEPPVISSDIFNRTYNPKEKIEVIPCEKEILDVLASINKTSVEDELNCGACGYNSCREKAIAVINGYAEKEMCIPYMKNKAEKLYTSLLESNPTGVAILDSKLNIIEVNQAFLNIHDRKKSDLLNRNIYLITEDPAYKSILEDNSIIFENVGSINNKKIKKIIYFIRDHNIIIVFLIDVTDVEDQKATLVKVKTETIERAQKVVNKQMRVAQEIAGLLGETTAETKVLLGQLIKILKEE